MDTPSDRNLTGWTITISSTLLDEFRPLAAMHRHQSRSSELVWALEQSGHAKKRNGKRNADQESMYVSTLFQHHHRSKWCSLCCDAVAISTTGP